MEISVLVVLRLFVIGKHLERGSYNPVPIEVEIGKRGLLFHISRDWFHVTSQ